jgi:hypothetical protein
MEMRFATLVLACGLAAAADPKMICFWAQPNAYLTDHAGDIKKIYDGFFIAGGNWDEAVKCYAGLD